MNKKYEKQEIGQYLLIKKMGESGIRTRDLLHPKQESYP